MDLPPDDGESYRQYLMANERTPPNPLPVDFVPEGAVETHRVTDGEDWASVAKDFNVKVDDLIYFNFHTNEPEEVNWYLRRNTGCNVSNDGERNWAFSSSADPGIIYIPPSAVINMDPEEVTGDTKTIMERLQEVAKIITGNEGIRIREIMDIATRVGSPGDEQLWYYNGGAVFKYIQLRTNPSERQEMTKDTNGQFPFDGDAGVNFGKWKIYPFQDITALDAANHQSDSDLKTWLVWLDGQISTSWHDMVQIHDVGGDTTEGLVAEFLDHVFGLAEIPTHLYFVYQHDK
jgi:hypothetical protein